MQVNLGNLIAAQSFRSPNTQAVRHAAPPKSEAVAPFEPLPANKTSPAPAGPPQPGLRPGSQLDIKV